MGKAYEVIGISHPLVDVCCSVSFDFLEGCGLTKGHFHLVDAARFKEIHDNLDKSSIKIELGGSVSNTLNNLNLLGISVGEFGKVGKDRYGDVLVDDKKEKDIGNFLSRHEFPTGTVLNLITPDFERTFAVCIGAASQLTENDIDEDVIKQANVLHTTGYEFESPSVRKAIMKAAKIAKQNNVLISMDLGDPGVIQRNFIALKAFVDEYVDILFANEEEAEEYTGKMPMDAAVSLGKNLDYAIVKIGEKGSYIWVAHSGTLVKIEAVKAKAVDTTGAGDMYSAGILYGIIRGLTIERSGKIASYAAAKVVETIGARLDKIDISHVI